PSNTRNRPGARSCYVLGELLRLAVRGPPASRLRLGRGTEVELDARSRDIHAPGLQLIHGEIVSVEHPEGPAWLVSDRAVGQGAPPALHRRPVDALLGGLELRGGL